MVALPPSRRAVLSAGAILASLGVIGAVKVGSDVLEDDLPGSRALMARTVPDDSDHLVQVNVQDQPADGAFADDPLGTETTTLLETEIFDVLPESLTGAFDDETDIGIDTAEVGKLLFVDSGALIWAHWDETELLAQLDGVDRDRVEPESYEVKSARESSDQQSDQEQSDDEGSSEFQSDERTRYSVDDVTATRLADTVFAVGTADVVRELGARWDGVSEPNSGEMLTLHAMTPREAPTRFTVDVPDRDFGTAFDLGPGETITHVYGAVYPTDADRVVELTVRTEPLDAAQSVADDMKSVLATQGDSSSDSEPERDYEPERTAEIIENVTVEYENNVATVEYRAPAEKYIPFVELFRSIDGI